MDQTANREEIAHAQPQGRAGFLRTHMREYGS